MTQVLSSDFKKTPVYFNWNFAIYWSAITNLESWESWVEDKMTSETHWFKNAMRVYAAELICSFQIFKLVFCIYNKLRLHAENLS